MIDTLLVVQLASTLFMTGLIWFVQVVHYPLFKAVGDDPSYHQQHQMRTSFVVLPPMLLELSASLGLLIQRTHVQDIAGAVLLMTIWLSTFSLQVPCHQKLLLGYDKATVRRLVGSNWIRTVAWTLRALVILIYT